MTDTPSAQENLETGNTVKVPPAVEPALLEAWPEPELCDFSTGRYRTVKVSPTAV